MSSYSWVLLVLVSFATASSSLTSNHNPDVRNERSRIRRVTQEVIVTEGGDGDASSSPMANNIFGDGDDSSSSSSSSMANNLFEWNMNHMMLFNGTNHTSRFHIGCEQLLKTNHDPEPLAPINVGGMSMSVDNAGGEGNNEEENDVEMTTTSDVMVSSGVAATAKNCINNFADTGTGTKYACSNINLMSFLNLATFASPNKCNGAIPTASDAWGWIDNGREFALVGLSNGAGFVEITDPLNPVYIGILLSHTGCSMWRNIKTYGNYAFVVSEASGHGLQVFDLRLLLTADPTKMPIEFPETAHYSKFGNSHTMDIDVAAGFAYAMGTNTYSGGLHIVNIQNPASPTLAGGFSSDGYTHDGQCLTCEYMRIVLDCMLQNFIVMIML